MLQYKLTMKKATVIFLLLLLTNNGWTDIAPNPIILKSIMTDIPCEIQMVTETVDIELYSDSSFVSCTFNMLNHGDSLTLPVGFPVMNFFHWSMGFYEKNDKDKFEIYVDSVRLDKNDIQVPERLREAYTKYLKVVSADEEYKRKQDSLKARYGLIEKRNKTIYHKGNYSAYDKAYSKILKWRETKQHFDSELIGEFDSLLHKGNYAWYIWKVKFKKGESKTIKVNYMVPSGVGYGADYRFFKYLISTGTGWKEKINKAEIKVRLNNVKTNTIETISPSNYKLDDKTKTISWTFENIEPTVDNDIYVRYYNPSERRKWGNFREKRARQLGE